MTEKTIRTLEPARNSFEAWNVNFYESKAETTNAWALAYALLGFWNMDRTGRCNPSLETLLAKTRIKSVNTLKKAIRELEEIGEWAVVRSKGRTSHYYYPMFVKNARTDLLNQGFTEEDILKNNEEETALPHNIPEDPIYEPHAYEQERDSYQPPASSYDVGYSQMDIHDSISHETDSQLPVEHILQGNIVPEDEEIEDEEYDGSTIRDSSIRIEAEFLAMYDAENPTRQFFQEPVRIPGASGVDVRIKTLEDQKIKQYYEVLKKEYGVEDPLKHVDLSICKVHLVLNNDETRAFNMLYDKFDETRSNPSRHFVVGGQGFLVSDELAPRWVEQFTLNYGPDVFSYSSIRQIYSKFLADYEGRDDWVSQIDIVDTAMYVLGNDGFVPTVNAIKALMFGTRLDAKMQRLREQFEETKFGRELTNDYIQRGLYTKNGRW